MLDMAFDGSAVGPEDKVTVPAKFIGKRDSTVSFEAVVIGLSEDGLGFRSSDTRLGISSLESIIRQPFECRFSIVGFDTGEIIIRITRIEACRKDPSFLYFGAAEFLSISDLDQLMLQTGLKKYVKKSSAPIIGTPPPPPLKMK